MRGTEGQQAGALTQKAALLPLLSFGLDPEQHFQAALARGHPQSSPATLTGLLRGKLRDWRTHAAGALRELRRRWACVGRHLNKVQPTALRAITHQRDLGFTTLLLMLVSWPDAQYPQGLLYGLPAVATSWPCGVFPQQEVEPIPLDLVFTDWQRRNAALVRTLKPGKDDVFLLEQSCKDADRGFSAQPMRHHIG